MIPVVSRSTQFNLEGVLGSKLVWGVLRALLSLPIAYHGPTEIGRAAGTSHASVSRVLRKLVHANLATRQGGRYRANADQAIIRYVWLLLQAERHRNLPAQLVNALELIIAETTPRAETAILFGSWARGIADEESDVDVCLFAEELRSARLLRPPYRFELHAFPPRELREPSRTVVLDALLNGISLRDPEGRYDAALELRYFPKQFLLARLEQAREFLARSDELTGAAQEYYTSLASMTLQQIESIVERGRTISHRDVAVAASPKQLLERLSARIAQEAERISLT